MEGAGSWRRGQRGRAARRRGVSAPDKEHLQKELELYREAIKLYRAGNWELAELHFVNLAKRAPKRALYKLYIERIHAFRDDPPPPDWDGVYTHLEK